MTGEVGIVNTMLCRRLLVRLPPDFESLYLANPSLSRTEILGAIADELGIPADGKTTHSMIRTLQDTLVERYAAGKRVVIMIDEAHAMPAESLEEIRLLSNLESKATKLLQIALFAQPELDERLAANDMRQLRERITQHFNLSPLKAGEVGNYIDFRLRAAGYHGPNPFTPRAVDMIARISEGLSRRINILADKSLLAAYSSGSHQVDAAQVKVAEQDARFSPIQQKTASPVTPVLKLAIAVLMTLALGAAAFALWPRTAVTSAVAPPTPASAPPTTAAPETPPRNAEQFPLTAQFATQFDTWLPSAASENYFIQLTARNAAHAADIENFLVRSGKSLDPAQLRIFRSGPPENLQIGIIYGDYPTRAAAWAAIRTLPEPIRRMRPYPRPVSALQ